MDGASATLRGFSPDLVLINEKPGARPGFSFIGGEGGIRTLGTLARTPDFESGTFNRSATSPELDFAMEHGLLSCQYPEGARPQRAPILMSRPIGGKQT